MVTVNILGTEYTITIKKYDEDKVFERCSASGYCSYTDKEIVLCDMSTYPDWENESARAIENQMKTTLRHEIVHAFLGESGLSVNSGETDAWARNEEMVDWIAIQGPKIWKAWQEAGAV
ncbi:MAG: hypothetical protein HFF84_09705 [Oscillibacter sp.]|nr:hypothetical protein [Oscillibacter sp.]